MKFREKTNDKDIFNDVYHKDEYKLKELLDKGFVDLADRIIDVGCHIGSFSKLAWDLGFKDVEAYEVNTDTFKLAQHNLSETRVKLLNKGVWSNKTTVSEMDKIPHSKIKPENLNWGGNTISANNNGTITTIPFSKLVDKSIGLLKLDCEGSEYPILYDNVRHLSKVKFIVAEYHPVLNPKERFGKTWKYDTTSDGMKKFLEDNKFDLDIFKQSHSRYAVNTIYEN